jgi:CHASE3 domain sensor protein
MSGDRGYLGQYLAALAELSPHVQKFRRAAGGNVALQRRVSALEGAIRELLKQWQTSLAHYERQPKDAGQQALMTRQAGELLKRIQAELGALSAVQQQWMTAREAELAREGQAVLMLAASVGVAALALAGLALAWMWRRS